MLAEFQNSFTVVLNNFARKLIPRLRCVAALPCKTWNL